MSSAVRRAGGVVGRIASPLFSPLFEATSALRRARTFHPAGLVFRADVEPLSDDGPLRDAAERMRGGGLVRLAGALWKQRESPDVLGLALRISDTTLPLAPSHGDQDLLFGTFRHVVTAPGAVLTTDAHDFLANIYYTVAPFSLDGVGTVKLRVVPLHPAVRGATRRERIFAALDDGRAEFRVDVAMLPRGRWRPFLRVRLLEPLAIDDRALRFSPFQADRGLVPTGLVHGLRRSVYPRSQRVRSRR